MSSRRDRLKGELKEAEKAMDAASRCQKLGPMRQQVAVAQLRCRVLGLRAELLEFSMADYTGKDRDSREKRAQLGKERASLLTHITNAERSARAASKQATDDDLPAFMARLDQQTQLGTEFDKLN